MIINDPIDSVHVWTIRWRKLQEIMEEKNQNEKLNSADNNENSLESKNSGENVEKVFFKLRIK